MTMWKRLISLGLSTVLVMAASGCSRKDPAPAPTSSSDPVPETSAPVTPAPVQPAETADPQGETVHLGLQLSLAGLGGVQMAEADAGNWYYEISLADDPETELLSGLSDGTLDMAVLPTNLAARLYNEQPDSIRLLGLNATGGLMLLENGDSVHSLSDLAGKTIYAANQGSDVQYVLEYLLTQIGIDPEKDVQIEWRPMSWLMLAAENGDVELSLLPSLIAEEVTVRSSEAHLALNLMDSWQELAPDSRCLTGCLAVRTEWLKAHKEQVPELMEQFASAQKFAENNPEKISGMLADRGVKCSTEAIQRTLGSEGLCWITGADMLEVSDFYAALFSADPESIGGGIPDDNFYYIP